MVIRVDVGNDVDEIVADELVAVGIDLVVLFDTAATVRISFLNFVDKLDCAVKGSSVSNTFNDVVDNVAVCVATAVEPIVVALTVCVICALVVVLIVDVVVVVVDVEHA